MKKMMLARGGAGILTFVGHNQYTQEIVAEKGKVTLDCDYAK
ncbi:MULTISPECIES: hypothetical protein [Corynebacterium]|nr:MULTISPECIES: hypothetical protein [Corynebacterium]MDK4230209.1 hypothetical protein [Corynebacterium tuberculostearicum]MDV2434871.1 hypothetical protein [Corynebacterium tuberculostearicum]